MSFSILYRKNKWVRAHLLCYQQCYVFKEEPFLEGGKKFEGPQQEPKGLRSATAE